jgi:hypothetical protein
MPARHRIVTFGFLLLVVGCGDREESATAPSPPPDSR